VSELRGSCAPPYHIIVLAGAAAQVHPPRSGTARFNDHAQRDTWLVLRKYVV